MQPITKSAILFFALASWAVAALPAGVQWDIRTTGSDSNGGGFVAAGSGTDWSQQNAAHTAFTDLVVGVTTTQVTSVLHPFGATDVGNLINVVSGSGCTTGRYQVVSVSVITATLDRSAGTAASVCTANLGGSLLTVATAFSASVSGNTFYLKSGTYTLTSSLSGPNFSYTFQGFASTHTDLGTAPLITTATNSTELLVFSGAASNGTFVNVNWSNTASVRAAAISQTSATGNAPEIFSACVFDGFTTALAFNAGSGHSAITSLALSDVEVKNSSSHGMLLNRGAITCVGCYFHDNAGDGISNTGGTTAIRLFIVNSIFANNANGISCVLSGDVCAVQSSVFYHQTTAGIQANNFQLLTISNSIFDTNGTYGVDSSTRSYTLLATNAYFGNGTAPTRNVAEYTPITLTGSPFVSSTNFALNSTAGAGISLKGAGYPGAFPGGTTTSHPDVGAVQSLASGGAIASGFIQ